MSLASSMAAVLLGLSSHDACDARPIAQAFIPIALRELGLATIVAL